jgi:hypothetical protein
VTRHLSGRERRWTRLVTIAAVTAATALVAACGSSTNPFPTPSSTPTSSVSPGSSPEPSDLKPVLAGLLDRDGPPPAEFLPSLGGFVVNVYWENLQPASGAALAPDNAIDQAIIDVRSLNAAHHTNLGLKIRLYAGIWAPNWVKDLGGPPIPITNPQDGGTGTIGRFWTAPFGTAYDNLETLLAAKYDSVPEIREVTIARCTTFYDEPFIRDTTAPATVSALIGAGYTVAADQTCQEQEIEASTVWHHTHSDLALNPYQVIEPDGSTSTDEPFTESMMQYCRQVLGTACILENNSLRDPAPGAAYLSMYQAMMELGAPIAFQTATADRVGSLSQTLAYAVSLGAGSVELPAGYESLGTPSSFASATRLLAGNGAAT